MFQLRGFEFAKAVTLVLEPFTLENGLQTPTFKASKKFLFLIFRKKKTKKVSNIYINNYLCVYTCFWLFAPCSQMKRPQAKAYFAKAIDDMYAELSASDASARKLL